MDTLHPGARYIIERLYKDLARLIWNGPTAEPHDATTPSPLSSIPGLETGEIRGTTIFSP
jgi:hypothetical protein